MVRNRTPNDVPENGELARQKAPDPLLIDRAIQEFVAERFEEGRLGFFTEYFKDRGARDTILKRFGDFLNSKEGYRTIANAHVNADAFDHEVRKTGYAMSTAIDASMSAVSAEFDFGRDSGKRRQQIRAHLASLRKEELAKVAASPKEREKAVANATKLKPANYRNNVSNYLKRMKEIGPRFTDEEIRRIEEHYSHDLEDVKAAFRGGIVSQDEIRTIVGLMTNDETKRLLLKAFLPSVSLGELVSAKIIDRKKAHEYLLAKIQKDAEKTGEDRNSMAQALVRPDGKSRAVGVEKWKLSEIVKTFDLDSVYVDTSDIDERHLEGAVLKTRLPKIIEERVAQGFREIEGVLATDFEISESRGAKNYKTVADKIVESFSGGKEGQPSIAGIEQLSKTEHWKGNSPVIIEGEAKYLDGDRTIQSGVLRLRVDKWNECPANDRESWTDDRTVTVSVLDELGRVDGEPRKLTYSELFRTLSSFENAKVLGSEAFGQEVAARESLQRVHDRDFERAGTPENFDSVQEYVAALNAEIPSFAELVSRLDEIDAAGKTHGLKAGTSFTLGKPGTAAFNVATVVGIDEAAKKVKIRNTKAEGSGQIQELSFAELVLAVKDAEFARISGADSAQGVLDLVAGSLMKSKFENLRLEEGRFVPKSRRDEPDYEGVQIFYGKNGKAFEVGAMENGRVRIRLLEKFNQGEQAKGVAPSAEIRSEFGWYGYETLYMLIRNYEATPFEGIVRPKKVAEPEYASQGYLKRLFNHASFSDLVHGLQEIPKFIKAKFEHSSHHHAAHVTLAIAEMLPGFPEDWLTDLQMQIHSEDKSTMEKEVQRLNGFPSPKRHAHVLKFLMNKGTKDYEIIAGALSLLEKHGNLYPGPLAKYENDWLFFRRMPGDAGEKERFLHKLRVGENGEKREVKEVDAIMLWLKEQSSAHHHPINPHYWLQVKKLWRTGTAGEFEMGGKEAQAKETFAERSKYVLDKFKGKEYAHGIGALQEVWNKPSATVTDRMKLPFVLAMSNIRTQIHTDLAEKFSGLFDAGHIYPPLLFIQFPDRQALFRRVVKKLCRSEDMMRDFGTIEKLIAGETVTDDHGKELELVDVLDKFWGKYGANIGKKLFVTVDQPEIYMRKDEDPDFAEYVNILGGELDGTNFKDVEIGMGTYGAANANPALLNPKAYVGKFKVNPGNAGLNGELEKFLAKEYLAAVEKIRDVRHPNEPDAPGPLTEKWQFQLYREYHKAFVRYTYETVTASKWGPSRTDKDKLEIEGEHWIQDAMEKGMSFKRPKEHWPSSLFETEKYEEWAKEDFQRFISKKTVSQERAIVSANLNHILGSGWAAPASRVASPAPAAQEPEPSGTDRNAEAARTEPRPETPAGESDQAVLNRIAELYDGDFDILGNIDSTVASVCETLRRLGLPVDAETRGGAWIKRTLANLFRATEAAMVDTVELQLESLAYAKLGQEIHSRYRLYREEADRTALLEKISAGPERDEVLRILSKAAGVTQEEYRFVGNAYSRVA